MVGYKLRLYENENGKRYDLDLHPVSQRRPLSELLKIPEVKVYANLEYDAQLLGPKISHIQNMEVQINGYDVETNFFTHSGNIHFKDNPLTGSRVFTNSFGLSYILIKFRTGRETHFLISDYFQVMVLPGPENSNVNTMGRYAAQHNPQLLYERHGEVICPRPGSTHQQYSMDDKVRHLKYVAYLLEKNLPHVSLASMKASRETMGQFRLDSSSIQELIHRPDAFVKVPLGQGIRIGSHSVAPDFTKLSFKDETELYEDQVLLSFIRAMNAEIPYLRHSLDQIRANTPTKMECRGEFVSSSSYMMTSITLILESMVEDLTQLQKQFSYLYTLYQSKLRVHDFELRTIPAPTSTFLASPAYRSIYEAMQQWFAMRQVNATDLRFTRSFLQITTVYEVYVLSKLCDFLEDWDFKLLSARHHRYDLEADTFYHNPEINNIFIYQKDDLEITIYYQPVVWEGKNNRPCICGLYRTTSLSFVRKWNETAKGRYYTPDYVIRIKRKGWKGARYVIADAKYTNYQDVHDFKIIPLTYKYLFSLGPKDPNDQIVGLYIFHGKRQSAIESKSLTQSVYDLLPNHQGHFPQVEIVSLYEYAGTIQREQFKSLRDLFTIQIEEGDTALKAELEAKEKMEAEIQARVKAELESLARVHTLDLNDPSKKKEDSLTLIERLEKEEERGRIQRELEKIHTDTKRFSQDHGQIQPKISEEDFPFLFFASHDEESDEFLDAPLEEVEENPSSAENTLFSFKDKKLFLKSLSSQVHRNHKKVKTKGPLSRKHKQKKRLFKRKKTLRMLPSSDH